MNFFRKFLSNDTVETRYVKAGAVFGDAVSYLYLGECIGFKKLLNTWAEWEKEYARRGYRTVSLDRFVELGGYGKPIDDVLGQQREPNEKPTLHAETYREQFLGKIGPAVNLEKLMTDGEIQSGTYFLPSTENDADQKQ